MKIQTDLRNGPVKPWKEVGCCEACWMAQGEKCVCSCGGAYHGMGNPNSERVKVIDRHMAKTEAILGPTKTDLNVIEQAEQLMQRFCDEPHTLMWFEKVTPTTCKDCGGVLGRIEHYPHDGGWTVEGFKEPLWLYRHCDKCGYDWAIWKLGVPRDA